MNSQLAQAIISSSILLASILPTKAEAPGYLPKWESLDSRPMPEWFLDAKFGVFIHWGVYSVPAWGQKGQYAEWYWDRISKRNPENPWWRFHEKNYGSSFDYKDFAPMFRAELFDVEHWVSLFEKAGVKYVVPTSKHHDGFALWQCERASMAYGRPWNSVDIGPRRDLIGEIAEATRAKGLKFGIYYSLYEWNHPLWLADRSRYASEHMTPQFKDVVTRYKPSLIFSDGEWDMDSSQWQSESLLAWLFNESPCRGDVVINDRWGKDCRHRHGGYWTTEYAAGLKDGTNPWEESRGMAHSYGLNRAERAEDYKSTRELVLVLVDLVSRGGNFLLNIGPAADGTIPPIMEQRLLEIGEWLNVNGEAIYGTRSAERTCQWTEGLRPKQEFGQSMVAYQLLDHVGQSPIKGNAVKQVFFTRKAENLYAITAGWPGKKLILEDIDVVSETSVTMLGYPSKLTFQVYEGKLSIDVPQLAPEATPCDHAFVFKITGARLKPILHEE